MEKGLIQGLGYVALATDDLDAALQFYTRVGRFRVSERRDKTAFLRGGGTAHHWLRLDEADQSACSRVAYRAVNEQALDEVTKRLDDWGIAWVEGGSAEEDRVSRWVRFHDMNGMEFEVYIDMVELPLAGWSTGVTMQELLHVGFYVESAAVSERFYREVLGFKTSDRVEGVVSLLRAENQFHHSLVLLQSSDSIGKLDHFCVEVESIDDVMRARNNAVRAGMTLRNDLLRHSMSGSMGVYVVDPKHGNSMEFCHGHCKITDPDYRPRSLKPSLDLLDMWQTDLPEIPIPAASSSSRL
jgi:2,3-dihydroxy-p-cumate/2,3-dihydroxybenzoate 3,4-dioxygenase